MSDVSGTWDPAIEDALEIVGVHAVVLHTGKVLFWCFDQRAVGQLGKDNNRFQTYFNDPNAGSYQIWDPATGRSTPSKPIGRNSFCAGQCVLPDGTVLVLGGQDAAGGAELTGEWDEYFAELFADATNGAARDVLAYDPGADAWTRCPDMADGRYYPTCVTLDDGSAFVVAGLSNLQRWVISGANWCQNDTYETVRPGALFAGPTAPRRFRTADQYPMVQQLPGSRTLFVHIDTTTYLFDLDSSSFVAGAEFVPPAPVGRITYPMQTGHVLLPQREGDPPRVLAVGGSTANGFDFRTHSDAPAALGAFVFDFDAAAPARSAWRLTANPPTIARLLADTVLLPDGTVFVVNGIAGGASAGHSQATVIAAEIYDPVTETFTAMAAPDAAHPRGYHSTAVLLPDARVAVAGNTDAYNPGEPVRHDDVSVQTYSPPYLFRGPRPVAAGVPASTSYGSTIEVDTSGGPDVTAATLMRPCAVTHTVDMHQRAILLEVTPGSGRVGIRIPSDPTLAPPGHYLLFLLAADGTPSVGSWISVTAGTPTYPAIDLGTYEGECTIVEVFDGDVTLEKIDQHCNVTLESRHGSITIRHKIDQHSYADLRAAGSIRIGEGIDQHSIVSLRAGGDVTLGQKINEYSAAAITAGGTIDIGQKVDNRSSAVLTAGTTVRIGEKLDQHSRVSVVAQGDVTIGQKIDQHATADITSVAGDITVGQGLSGSATATLRAAAGDIVIGDSVDPGSTLVWEAHTLSCPHLDGDVTRG